MRMHFSDSRSSRMKTLTPFINFYQFCGFHPASLSNNRHTFWIFINFLYMFCAVVAIIVISTNRSSILYTRKGDFVGTMNDFIKFLFAFGSHLICLIEAFRARGRNIKLLEQFHAVERCFSNEDKHVRRMERLKRILVCKLFILTGSHFLAQLVSLLIRFRIVQIRNFILFFTFPFYLAHVRQFQSTFYTSTLSQYMEALDDKLDGFMDQVVIENNINNKIYDPFLSNEIQKCHEVYQLLYDISKSIDDIFGWSQTINCMKNHFTIVSDAYFIVLRIHKRQLDNFQSKFFLLST